MGLHLQDCHCWLDEQTTRECGAGCGVSGLHQGGGRRRLEHNPWPISLSPPESNGRISPAGGWTPKTLALVPLLHP